MSTDVTRGPNICPSCGRENAPTAAHCSRCLAPLEGAVQTGPSPPRDVGLRPPLPDEDAPRIRRPLPAWASAGLFVVGAFLVLLSGAVTFFAVCTAAASLAPGPGIETAVTWGLSAGILTAVAVVIVLLIVLDRFLRR